MTPAVLARLARLARFYERVINTNMSLYGGEKETMINDVTKKT